MHAHTHAQARTGCYGAFGDPAAEQPPCEEEQERHDEVAACYETSLVLVFAYISYMVGLSCCACMSACRGRTPLTGFAEDTHVHVQVTAAAGRERNRDMKLL